MAQKTLCFYFYYYYFFILTPHYFLVGCKKLKTLTQNIQLEVATVNLVVGEKPSDVYSEIATRSEKCQSEEEATLGRGKRVRKVVSCREVYPPFTQQIRKVNNTNIRVSLGD
ncbi:uncharacterized protein LOC111894317 [Lactuca sativa]|uniref:uncharacterized protein LOC111894317 n=1 Tax=Lactuca sativa TaxID=4236 RepID=UPI0022AFD77A|nr:uncharacterized protein LOC111894317 [Lactuca sativa]